MYLERVDMLSLHELQCRLTAISAWNQCHSGRVIIRITATLLDKYMYGLRVYKPTSADGVTYDSME